jgi:hypothetical protein
VPVEGHRALPESLHAAQVQEPQNYLIVKRGRQPVNVRAGDDQLPRDQLAGSRVGDLVLVGDGLDVRIETRRQSRDGEFRDVHLVLPRRHREKSRKQLELFCITRFVPVAFSHLEILQKSQQQQPPKGARPVLFKCLIHTCLKLLPKMAFKINELQRKT